MSFTRFRKERSKASSVQDNKDYVETVAQQDNRSQYSQGSREQYQYQQRPQAPISQQQKRPLTQSQNTYPKYNNDINNLPRSK